jgi:hypothetical protein
LLAASDERDPSLEIEANRRAIAPLDGVIGCGDLDPHWLDFLADAFHAPLVYVRGNHDQGGDWDERNRVVPEPLAAGATTRLAGIIVGGLEWPHAGAGDNRRRPDLAWGTRSGRGPPAGRDTAPSVVMISHVAPEGVGDVASDLYHREAGLSLVARPDAAAPLAPATRRRPSSGLRSQPARRPSSTSPARCRGAASAGRRAKSVRRTIRQQMTGR